MVEFVSRLGNPWMPAEWNLTRQAEFIRLYGRKRADLFAAKAGTTVGGEVADPLGPAAMRQRDQRTFIIQRRVGGGGQSFTFGADPPASPSPGDEWMDSDTGDLYKWIDDGNSSQWVAWAGADAQNYVHPNHTGDVTSAGDGATTIAANAVSFAKFQQIGTDKLLGRDTAGTGNVEELAAGGGLEFTGTGGVQRSALTGDVTAAAGSNATTIANDAVTNAKAANMAQSTIKGRAVGAGTGDPTDLTAAEATAILNTFTATLKGLVPSPGAGSAKLLRADGTWAYPEIVTKPSGESVTNSTTLQDDNHLLFAVAASEIVYFMVTVKHVEDGAENADIKFAMKSPSGLSDGQIVPVNGIKVNEADSIVLQSAHNLDPAPVAAIPIGTGLASRYTHLAGYIANGANAGNVTLQWAQNTAQNHAVIVQPGSSIIVWRT